MHLMEIPMRNTIYLIRSPMRNTMHPIGIAMELAMESIRLPVVSHGTSHRISPIHMGSHGASHGSPMGLPMGRPMGSMEYWYHTRTWEGPRKGPSDSMGSPMGCLVLYYMGNSVRFPVRNLRPHGISRGPTRPHDTVHGMSYLKSR